MTELEEDNDDTSRRAFLMERDGFPGDDRRRVAPAALRNETAIVRALATVLEDAGLRDDRRRALELASGTGQHCAALARVFPGITWTPSDRDDVALDSIAAWRDHAALANIEAPLKIDLHEPDWTNAVVAGVDVMLAINLLHISPWPVTGALLRGASQLLFEQGLLAVYGCFKRDGDWVSDSNRAFDADLRMEDERWGVRDTADVAAEATRYNLTVMKVIEMPANNTMLVLRPR